MCNCGAAKRRAAAAAAAGGGAPRGCVGPGCGVVRVAPVALAAAAPVPAPTARAMRRAAPLIATPTLMVAATPVHPPTRMPTEEELPTVDTEIWGPHMWRFLHAAAEQTGGSLRLKREWDALLEAMRTGLPCPDCREHYGSWMDTHPFVAPAANAKLHLLIRAWILALHNAVNARRGVAEWTSEQVSATEAYRGGRATAREALAAAAAAGVAPWVIAAGESVIERAMM
jgi:hypothetical protein